MVDWKGAFQGRLEPGQSPALLLVDPVRAYLEAASPLALDSGASARDRMADLAAAFRSRNLPVVWTGVRYCADGSDGGRFFQKVPALQVFAGDNPLGGFPAELAPEDGERVFIKQYPSAFFGTALDQWLHDQGVDTLYLGGFSTSGCVRASALDALQHGFIPMIVADACADRSDDIHAQNLRDLSTKYGEIVQTVEVPGMLDSCSQS